MIRFYRKFFRHQYPGLLMPLVAVAVWTRFMLLAAMALFQRQESSASINVHQDQIATKLVAQEKRIMSPGVEPDSDAAVVDPMLVIASTEVQHPYNRPS